MKDIPIEELAAISPEIHQYAARIGCTHVSITGQIWPGGRLSGEPQQAARFMEYSWFKAAVIDGRAIFEASDPKAYATLLAQYGLGDEPDATPDVRAPEQPIVAERAPVSSDRTELHANVVPATLRELERQAGAEGLTVGEYLDWKFQPRPVR
jgi:hypothetical protein